MRRGAAPLQGEGGGAGTAPARVAPSGNGTGLQTGRQGAAWRGRVPRPPSPGGTQRLGHSSTRGEVYRRPLRIHGARRVRQGTGKRTDAKRRGAERLPQRRGNTMTAVA
jgi:transposase